jgi:hypothetical protein
MYTHIFFMHTAKNKPVIHALMSTISLQWIINNLKNKRIKQKDLILKNLDLRSSDWAVGRPPCFEEISFSTAHPSCNHLLFFPANSKFCYTQWLEGYISNQQYIFYFFLFFYLQIYKVSIYT